MAEINSSFPGPGAAPRVIDSVQFAEFVRDSYARIYLLAYSAVRDADMANDLAQEAFLRAWLKLDTLRDAALLEPWLARIVRNLSRQWLRTGRSRSRILPLISLEEIEVEPMDEQAATPRDLAKQKEQERQLHDGVMGLSDDLRETVLLHYADGLSVSDMARLTGEAPSTISRRLNRAHDHLRNYLKEGNALPLAGLRPGKASTSRALALITAAVALPSATRAELLKTISDTAMPPSSGAKIQSVTHGAHTEAGPMKLFGAQFGLLKIGAVVVIAAAAIGGGTYLTKTAKTSVDPNGHESGHHARITAMAASGGVEGDAARQTSHGRLHKSSTDIGQSTAGHPSGQSAAVASSITSTGQPATTASAVATTSTLADAASSDSVVTIAGTLRDKITSQPIANALVRAATGAPDMREIRKEANQKSWPETHTDSSGYYKLIIPLKDGVTSVALDAFAPGYRSLAGTMMSGGETGADQIPVTPGQSLTRDFTLPSALYAAGRVVDENGKPLANVQVGSTLDLSKGMAFISYTVTNKKGQFQIFDFPYPEEKEVKEKEPFQITGGVIALKRDDLNTTFVKDIYAVPASEQSNLKIVMSAGVTLTGQLLTAAGEPATSVSLAIQYGKELRNERRDVTTDRSGSFELKGLPSGHASLYARAMAKHEVLRAEIEIPTSNALTLQMVPMQTVDTSGAVNLLGMKLIDNSPELAAAYDLSTSIGVMVLDPGTGIDRLTNQDAETRKSLAEGAQVWMIGGIRISNLRDFVSETLRVNQLEKPVNLASQPLSIINQGYKDSVRIVWNDPKEVGNSAMTERMKLTPADLSELESYLKTHTP